MKFCSLNKAFDGISIFQWLFGDVLSACRPTAPDPAPTWNEVSRERQARSVGSEVGSKRWNLKMFVCCLQFFFRFLFYPPGN